MQTSLIQELKRNLSKEKLKILNLLLAQMDLMDEQLRQIRTEANYQEQMRSIDELMEKDQKKAA